jgi:hypothetical protein
MSRLRRLNYHMRYMSAVLFQLHNRALVLKKHLPEFSIRPHCPMASEELELRIS